MRIVHVVDSMEVGGAETLVLQMCRLQRELGHDPCVYAVAALGALGERMRAEGFVVRANIGEHLLDATLGFVGAFRDSRPDVVHLHNPTPTIYAAMAARVADVRSIVSTRHSLMEPPRQLVAELKYTVAAKFCDWIVGICDATTLNLRSAHVAPGRKVLRVYNGTVPLSRAVREQWPPKNGFTFLYIGRLAPVKNLPLLLNAFRAALLSMPNLRLWIVGDGIERATLETMASDLGIARAVTFWGQQLDVAPFYSAADAFIMSSKSEGLPMALLQAFSLGLPVIVTDVGGMAEVVRLAGAGLIVSAAGPAEMAVATLQLARNDVEREQFSQNAQAAFQAHFTLLSMVNAYMNLYRNTARFRRTDSR